MIADGPGWGCASFPLLLVAASRGPRPRCPVTRCPLSLARGVPRCGAPPPPRRRPLPAGTPEPARDDTDSDTDFDPDGDDDTDPDADEGTWDDDCDDEGFDLDPARTWPPAPGRGFRLSRRVP